MELSIPTTSVVEAPKPHTVYTISIRQSLRNYSLAKRYSDFTALQDAIVSQCHGVAPPTPLPQKSWFKSTVSSPDLTEQRRKGLEEYLRTINESNDARWRSSQAWRSFLNLPSNTTMKGDPSSRNLDDRPASSRIRNPTDWLDIQRDAKTHLRDARLHLNRRDQASSAQVQHEASADVKRCLVKASAMTSELDESLRSMSTNRQTVTTEKSQAPGMRLGDGEIRRRKDLIGALRKDLASLEDSLAAYGGRSNGVPSDGVVPSAANKDALLKRNNTSGGRVLGAPMKETDRTRELGNAGVLQLQKQIMEEQEVDVSSLTAVVSKMKQMGIQINDELEVQNELLGMLGQDVERVDDKIKIAKKRITKIS